MKKIYKYAIGATDHQIIELPKGSQILTVQSQHNTPWIWALVNPDADKEEIGIWTFGTGHEMTDSLYSKVDYLGTYQLEGGQLVFHVFVQF